MLVLFPSLLEGSLSPEGSNHDLWLYWLDVFSGNWNSEQGVVSRWTFAFSACLSVLLNNALIISLPLLIWRLVVERKRQMLLAQAFATRDALNKQHVLMALNVGADDVDTRAKISRAFRDGEKTWKDDLRNVFGPEKAEKIIAMLNETI